MEHIQHIHAFGFGIALLLGGLVGLLVDLKEEKKNKNFHTKF